MKNLAIFLSGGGSNAQSIIDYLKNDKDLRVALVVSENPNAYGLERARLAGIETFLLPKDKISDGAFLNQLLREKEIDCISLAGYLKKIPDEVVSAFPNKILNIHPSLLPRFGGKGMYGLRVHQAVKDASEKETGMTIHFVNEKYDEGGVVFQDKIKIEPHWTAEEIQKAVLTLEHQHYPYWIKNTFIAQS